LSRSACISSTAPVTKHLHRTCAGNQAAGGRLGVGALSSAHSGAKGQRMVSVCAVPSPLHRSVATCARALSRTMACVRAARASRQHISPSRWLVCAHVATAHPRACNSLLRPASSGLRLASTQNDTHARPPKIGGRASYLQRVVRATHASVASRAASTTSMSSSVSRSRNAGITRPMTTPWLR